MAEPNKYEDINIKSILNAGINEIIKNEGYFNNFCKFLSGQNLRKLNSNFLDKCLEVFSSYTMDNNKPNDVSSKVSLITNELNRRFTRSNAIISFLLACTAIVTAVWGTWIQ